MTRMISKTNSGWSAKIQAGNDDAFHELYLRFSATVYRCAILPIVRDPTVAEDMLADTFVRAFENLGRFQWQGRGVLPWLLRIGRNLCLDYLRKSGRIDASAAGFEATLPDQSGLDGESATADLEIGSLMRERIAECMAEVNPRYRRVLQLRLVEGESRERAAEAMDVTIGTLDVLLFRACKAFRKVYVRRYGIAPRQDLDLVS